MFQRVREIYKIITPTGKIYYGQHLNKKYPLDDGYMGSGWILRESLKKYGEEKHTKIILYVVFTKEDADQSERYEIAQARIRGEHIINITDGGQGGLVSEAQRQGIIKSNKERIITESHKQKTSMSLKGRKQSAETRLKKSIAHKGKVISEDQRLKISKANKGKKRTQETKLLLSKIRKGVPQNITTKQASERSRKAQKTKKQKRFNPMLYYNEQEMLDLLTNNFG